MLQEEHYFDPSFRPARSGRRYYEYFASFPPVRRAANVYRQPARHLPSAELHRFPCCPSVPRPLDIAANENGKPYLTAAPDVHFSLSHSAAWAVCAVSDHPVGVDIQQCRSFKPNIADRFFHPDEVQYLSSLSPAERENAFYTLWALKESYVKADGRGLRLLRQFCVDIACQPPAITVGAPGSLFVPDFPDPAYRLGVCVQKKNETSPTLTVLPQLSTP